MLNWIVWNRTDYLYKMDLALNNLQRLICHKIQTTNQTNIKYPTIVDMPQKQTKTNKNIEKSVMVFIFSPIRKFLLLSVLGPWVLPDCSTA